MKNLLFSVFHEKQGPVAIYSDINDEATIKGCTTVLISVMSNMEQDQKISGEAIIPLLGQDLVLFIRYFHLDISDAQEKAFAFVAWILEKDNKDLMYYNSHKMLNLFVSFESSIKQGLKSGIGNFESLKPLAVKAVDIVKEELGTILDDFFMCSVEELQKTIPLDSFVEEICLICYRGPTEIKKLMGTGSSNVNVGALGTKIATGLLLNMSKKSQGQAVLPVIQTNDTVFCSFYTSGKEIFMVLILSKSKDLIYEWANMISDKTHGMIEIMKNNDLKINSNTKYFFKNELK